MESLLAISIGAIAGALLRWGVGVLLNPLFPPLPAGTLAVNVIGAYLMGLAMALFAVSDLAPEWRLLTVTGFLGTLTTFSTFSAEVVSQLQSRNYAWAAAIVTAHLIGSLGATFLGIATYAAVMRR